MSAALSAIPEWLKIVGCLLGIGFMELFLLCVALWIIALAGEAWRG
jgi:hypothetical protein